MGLFVKLDTNWPDDESVIEVGLDGAGLHAHIMCIAKRTDTDGWVGRRTLARYGATDELIERLATCDPEPLLERRDDGAVRSAGWLKANPSKAALAAQRAAKAEAGRRGNHVKHLHPGEYGNCRLCNPVSQVVAGCETPSSHPLAGSDTIASPETETESVTGVARTSSHPGFAGPTPTVLSELRAGLRSVPVEGNETDADRTVTL